MIARFNLRLYSALLLIISFCSCKLNTTAPPVTAGNSSIPAQDTSRIFIPVTINYDSLVIALKNEIKNPMVDGRSDELNIKMLINEDVSVIDYVKQLIKAGTPGYNETKEEVQTVVDHIKIGSEAYGCWLKPWKWGDCWRDVYGDVKRQVTVSVNHWVDEVPAEYATVAIPAIKIQEKLFPTSAWINYKINLENLDIKFTGSQFLLTAYADYEISVDVKQGILGFNQQVKGALQTTGKVVYTMDGAINLGNDGSITLQNNNSNLKWADLDVPLAIEAIELNSVMNPDFFVIKEIVGKVLQNKINDETTNFLNKQNSKANLKEKIIALLQKTNGPFQLQKNLFFAPNIHKAFITSVSGESNFIRNTLTIKTGVYLSPSIFYTDSTPLINNNPTYTNNAADTNAISSMTVSGIVSYNLIASQIQNNLNALIQSKYSTYGFTIGEVKVYPSNEKLAISLELLKKGNSKGYFYFTAIPKFDSSSKMFFLYNVEFTSDSKSELMNVAGWLVNNKIEKFVEEKGKYDATNKLKEAVDTIKSFTINSDFISINGQFTNLKISDVYLKDSALAVYVSVSGKLTAAVNTNHDNQTFFGAK